METPEVPNDDLLTSVSESVSKGFVVLLTSIIVRSLYIPIFMLQDQLPFWVTFWLDPRLVILAIAAIGLGVST